MIFASKSQVEDRSMQISMALKNHRAHLLLPTEKFSKELRSLGSDIYPRGIKMVVIVDKDGQLPLVSPTQN